MRSMPSTYDLPLKYAIPVIAAASLVLLWIMLSHPGYRKGEISSAFERGMTFYGEGRYREAADAFTACADRGERDGRLFYNIGNSLLKEGRLGEALWWYERSRLVMPRYPSLEANYDIAMRQVKQRVAGRSSRLILPWLRPLLWKASAMELCAASAVLLYGWTIAFGITIWRGGPRPWLSLFGSISFASWLVLLPVCAERVSWAEQGAVVMVRMTDALREPLKSAETAFPLYEGMGVKVLKRIPGWAKVERADGKVGWLAGADVKRLAESAERPGPWR